MKCCGVYYACKDCHHALAGHPIEVWPDSEWIEKAILCGACGQELTIHQYMQCEFVPGLPPRIQCRLPKPSSFLLWCSAAFEAGVVMQPLG